MKALILILIAIFLFSSCTTERKCAEKYPTEIITKDSLVIKEVIKEVIIHDTVFINADTVHSSDTVFIRNGLIYSLPVFAAVDFANATAQVRNSKILLELIQNDTAIARLLRENIIIEEKEIYKTETIIKKVWISHWYDKAARVIASIFIIAILVIIAIKIIKMYIKPF